VNTLSGHYITAMDVGMTQRDMPIIARGTKYVAGVRPAWQVRRKFGAADCPRSFEGLKAAVKPASA